MTRNAQRKQKTNKKGISIKKTTYVIAVLFAVISALLLVATFRVATCHGEMNRMTDEYIRWQAAANNMRVASDYLTEQVRYYVETGDEEFIKNYFEEINVTKRREKVLEAFYDEFNGLAEYSALEQAMAESQSLAERECYAMRLKAEAIGVSLAFMPDEVANVTLTDEDESLNAAKKDEKAHEMVFDAVYRGKKDKIYEKTESCLESLDDTVEEWQGTAAKTLTRVLINERILISLFLVVIFTVFWLNAKLIYKPLVVATAKVKNDETLTVGAVEELRFLAEAYNEMHEKNRQYTAGLKHKATHDPLTKVRNRSGLTDYLKSADHASAAILVIDADDYKLINDKYGHDVGDKILIRIAEKLTGALPEGTFVARVGGDEFCVILFADKLDGRDIRSFVGELIERINEELRMQKDLPAVSISCGVGFCEDKTGGEAMRRADKALYKMKRNGKNGCYFED